MDQTRDGLSTSPSYAPRLAGDLAIWIFILAELLAFGVLFLAYAFARAKDPALFSAEQVNLNRTAGAINTALLLTASYFVVRAVHAAEQQLGRQSSAWLLAALITAGGFIVVKLAEYNAAFSAGISLSSSTFHMFYLSLTFFHFMHVLLGMVILGVLCFYAYKSHYGPDNMNGMESGAAYWHMVDLLWLVLFPLVYVIH